MEPDSLQDREWREWATRCLEIVREATRPKISEREALQRARELEARIRAGRISAEEVRLDEEFKEVLYALVYRILPAAEDGNAGGGLRAAVGDFIRRIAWDDPEERDELWKDCAEATPAGGRSQSPAPIPGDREAAVPSTDGALSAAEARSLFDRALPLVHFVLVEAHQLTENEARELERELSVWFLRFHRRPDNPPKNPRRMLVAAASQFARQYRRFAAESVEPATDSRLTQLLQWALAKLERERAGNAKKGPASSD